MSSPNLFSEYIIFTKNKKRKKVETHSGKPDEKLFGEGFHMRVNLIKKNKKKEKNNSC
jgi:hypothetical protein